MPECGSVACVFPTPVGRRRRVDGEPSRHPPHEVDENGYYSGTENVQFRALLRIAAIRDVIGPRGTTCVLPEWARSGHWTAGI